MQSPKLTTYVSNHKMKDIVKKFNLLGSFWNQMKFALHMRFPLFVLLGVPIIYPVLMSLTYVNMQVLEREVVVLDLDHSALSRETIFNLNAHQGVNVSEVVDSLDAGIDRVMQRQADALIFFPPDFSTRIKKGEEGNLKVYTYANNMMTYATLLTGVQMTIIDMNNELAVAKHAPMGATVDRAKSAVIPFTYTKNILYLPSLAFSSFLMPMMFLVVFQQVTWISTGFSMGMRREEERRLGRRRKSYYFVEYLGFFLFDLSILVLGFLFVYIPLAQFFVWPTGSLTLMLPFIIFYCCVQFPLGVCFAEFFNDRYAAFQVLLCFSVPTMMMSGYIWPLFAMPEWVQTLSSWTAISHASEAVRIMAFKGGVLADILPQCLEMLKVAGAYALAAIVIIHLRALLTRPRKEVAFATEEENVTELMDKQEVSELP